jgi:photosystem II stability/assembly factor-like uncharacterized protein
MLVTLLQAQTMNMEQLKNIHIRSIGPAAMSGRVTSITTAPNNTDVIYAGTASGGVWRSKSGGTDWQPIFDEAPCQSIGAVAINPQNPDEIWVGTGEGNPRNSQNFGIGIFRSMDGGAHWQNMGLSESRAIHRIIIHKNNPAIIWAAVIGSPNGISTERGVYKTTDSGKTWRKVLYINDLTGCADLVTDANNPNKLVAAMWEHRRWPWFFKSGGAGSGIHISYDGGETWTRSTEKDGLPEGDLGRVGLAISPANSDVVYALVEAKDNALYKSTDGGKKWKKMAEKNQGNRPFYYAEIHADPKDENRLYSIHTTITSTEDGGKTFEEWVGWQIHVDHHAFWINPNNPNHIIDGNDGGLNITLDRGKTWRFAENIPVGQFYHIDVDNAVPYNIYGGLQDNGTWFGPSAVYRESGIRNADWREVVFGDGFDAQPVPDNQRFMYGMYQGGNLYYVDKETGNNSYIKPTHPQGKTLRYNWNSALAVDPNNPRGLYFGSQYVHYSPDHGATWSIISPDLTTNDTSKMHQDVSGGLTLDATNAENHCNILCIAPSANSRNHIYVGTDDGQLQLTRDGGKNWESLTAKLPNCPKNAWIPQIEVSKTDANEAWVVVNNYRMNDFAPYLYHTTDGGKTWSGLAKNTAVVGFTLCVVQDPKEKNLVFLGTDQGLFVSFDRGANWNKWWRESFPSVPVQDMKIQERESDLVIGTFGRAIYVLDDIGALRSLATTNGRVLQDSFRVFAPQPATDFAQGSYEGVRFSGSTIYEGENDPQGMQLRVWVNPALLRKAAAVDDKKKEDKKEDKKDDTTAKKDKKPDLKAKVKLIVISMSGDTVRQFSRKIDSCMQVIRWRLDSRGVRYASKEKPDADADEPGGGPTILPGKYRISVEYQGLKDSTLLEIKADPRLPQTLEARTLRYNAIHDFQKYVAKSTDAYNRLKDMEATMARVETAYTNVPDSLKKDLIAETKTLRDTITALKGQFFEHVEPKGIQRNPNKLNAQCYRASGYLEDVPDAPTPNSLVAVQETRLAVDAMVMKVNKLKAEQWAAWRKKADAVQFSLFQDWEDLK